ncbi:ABC transporter permease [Brevibacillus sp. GCM10020057]|uniref:ABC transporter permease n=1 Tax=Brevibacillus sp. GCM10020057 TaxID=3317327 RepID=UPI0036371A77
MGGGANVYSKTVTIIDQSAEPSYQAYNLAELAAASGGAGYTIGDNLEPYGDGYISVGHFRTTPQPSGQVSTDKTKYKVNEQVTISANATDYSYYDRGILVWNLSVINKTTGKGYYQFESNREVRDQSGYLPPVNESSSPKPFPWSQVYQYKPTEPGLYEVTLTITDRHHRARQGSASMSVSTPYTYQFTVGDVPVDPDPDPDPEPPAGCKQTAMDLRFERENSDRELSAVPSGGETIELGDDTRIVVTAAKPGTFKHNGAVMESGPNNNRKLGITEAQQSGTFTITYASDDGTECWQKTFKVNDGEDGIDRCPIITVNGSNLSNGATLEVTPGEEVRLSAKYTNAYGEQGPAEIKWDVTRPDGSVETLPGAYDEVGGRERWGTWNSAKLTLPFGKGNDKHDVLLERGKTYRVKLNFEGALWYGRPECDWVLTIKVRDIACTIAEQQRIEFFKYGEPPSEFPPGGTVLSSLEYDPIYEELFTQTPSGYDTHMKVSANAAGSWYLEYAGKKVALGQKLAANEKLDVVLPEDYGVGEPMKLVFLSETGCIREFAFTVISYKRCYGLLLILEDNFSNQAWTREIERGETVQLEASDIPKGKSLKLFTGEDTKYVVQWFDPDTQTWEYERGDASLPGSSNPRSDHWLRLPRDEDTDMVLGGLYKVVFYDDAGKSPMCDGYFFLQIGDDAPRGENLLIVKSSFSISPKQPQAAGTASTITFQVKNAGQQEHDTTLAVRWESSPQETTLAVDNFKPGEVRTITVPTKYPQQGENFIAHINPAKNRPDNETIWSDNRALWPVQIPKEPEIPNPPGGGGDFDGGEIGLEIYDSDGRELQKLAAQVDGVWEREPATIRVVIDQTKINEGFLRTQQEINAKIAEYKSQLAQSVSGEGIQNVTVTAQPGWIADARSMAVYSPERIELKVSGPGAPQSWQVSSASTGGDYVYTGTIVPTETTWREELQQQKYKAQIDGFVIVMDYSVRFDLSYDSCTTDDEGQEACEAKSVSKTMAGRYTITVKGGERTFAVFEPNATGTLRHTAEWAEYHARDRYPNSRPDDFYAGERILSQIELEPRHRHPVSGKYPVIVSAQAWIAETGMRQTSLQSQLSLVPASPQLWRGPTYSASKLGQREVGVDIPLMGDKQRGFQKDSTYAVYFSVQFRFDAKKGFAHPVKSGGQGHALTDYRIPFRIIANAWERQGIRNHTTR